MSRGKHFPVLVSFPSLTRKKLSHCWRERDLLRSLMLKSFESYLSERPAVGSSDWLAVVFMNAQASSQSNKARLRLSEQSQWFSVSFLPSQTFLPRLS